MSKLAVFFPGIGYTVDKPLMHYSRQIAAAEGYEIKLLPYAGFPKKIRGDRERMEESFQIAVSQSREMLADTDFSAYEEILFVGKSIGTIVAGQIAKNIRTDGAAGNRIRFVLYTPLEDTFSFPLGEAIVFTGTADPWTGGKDSRIAALAGQRGYPCHLIPEANHSLETGDALADIRNLETIMEETKRFISAGE